ncbi:hypothetical protein G6M87_09335 [Rhizobium rhizogenes]|uniref:hypothetical protein n=1 Tax=Rhizobium rhizogenes TaxID=359 RepID=UPI001571BB41|nr:hypothetical protein [Rhizobium rhizogenes]NTI22064.1 hypothetical protein [Rhizobium rhizogenes]QTG05665.1 hypothetical protein G6M87_09335 [Rhizobium rhizogenes]
MQDQKPDWQYWIGWIVAYSFAGCVFIYAVLTGTFDQNWCTGSKDEQCLREWLSALGGWAAVAAAIPTVFYLSRQIEQARRQHLQNMRLNTRRNLQLARSAQRASDRLHREASQYSNKLLVRPVELAKIGQSDYVDAVDALLRHIENDNFQKFEDEFGFGRGSRYSEITELLRDQRKHVADKTYDFRIGDHAAVVLFFEPIVSQVLIYANDCREVATRYINDALAILNDEVE